MSSRRFFRLYSVLEVDREVIGSDPVMNRIVYLRELIGSGVRSCGDIQLSVIGIEVERGRRVGNLIGITRCG